MKGSKLIVRLVVELEPVHHVDKGKKNCEIWNTKFQKTSP